MLSNFKNFFSKKEIVFNNELPNLNPKFYSDLSTKESYDVFFQELKEILNDNDNKIEKFKLELTTLFSKATIHV